MLSFASAVMPWTVLNWLGAAPHHDLSRRVELDDHVRAFVGHPDVVLLVDAHGMRKRRRVIVRTPLLDELQALVELEELRRGRAFGGTRIAAPREHEQVVLR